jgi:DNA (cytosine-5)-methyltransferase 1
MKQIKIGSQFTGVGAFEYACYRVFGKENIHSVYAAEWDKFARTTYLHNHQEPDYYVNDVYDTPTNDIEQLDIAMFSPPCQAFSIAGKRKGESDDRGVLFYNSHEFIQKNNPRFFLFENVKGLLSDDNGKTFGRWIDYLAGKSINGNPVIFPREESVPYHVYYRVLNSKNFGVPQNRERVFIIGIRDDEDNNFRWPMEQVLEKRLKDILEDQVDKKYFLSDKKVSELISKGFDSDHLLPDKVANTLRCGGGASLTEKHSFDMVKVVGNTNPSGNGMNGNVFDENGISPTITTNKGEGIKIKSATKKGYEIATENDSINFSVPNSETRRGCVGKEVAQTLDTQCNQGVMVVAFGISEEEKQRRKEHFQRTGKDSGSFKDKNLILKNQEYYDTLLAHPNPQKEGLIYNGFKIRRLTPRECFRLQDFPDTFDFSVVSDSQAYKQAGNSITVRVLEKILEKLNL